MLLPYRTHARGVKRSFSSPIMFGLALTIGATNPSFAQSTDEEEVFELSPFEVSSTGESGYHAAESISGSRIRTKIAELPYSVNVVTNEFLEDFNADSLDDQFAYVSSFAGDEVEGWYQLRGFKQNNQMRNGFTRLGLVDRVTISRAEVIKGPAAGSYGKIDPGGMINVITKSASETPEQEFSIELGTDSYQRYAIGTTGPITEDKKWLYRLDGAWYDRDDFAFTGRDQLSLSGVVEYNPTERTEIIFEREYIERDTLRDRGLVPLRDDTLPTNDQHYRFATELYDFSLLGPDALNERTVNSTDVRFSHQFSDTFSVRAGFNTFNRFFNERAAYPGEVRLRLNGRDPSEITSDVVWEEGVLRDLELRHHRIWERGDAFQVDFLKEYSNESLEGRFLVTFDRNKFRRVDDRKRINRTDQSPSRTMPLSDPDYSFLGDRAFELANDVEGGFGRVDRGRDNITKFEGIYVANQLKMLDGDLNLNAGFRYDDLSVEEVSDNSSYFGLDDPSFTPTTRDTNQESYQLGVNYRIAEGLMLYASKSTSFNLNPRRATNDTDPVTGAPITPEVFDAEKGDGYEVGIKGDSVGGKLSFTLAYFDTDREDIVLDLVGEYPAGSPHGDPGDTFNYLSQAGLVNATGVEFDFNYAVNKELSFTGGIGFVDSEMVDVGDENLAGLPVAQIPDYSANVVMKYGSGDGIFYMLGVRDVGESRWSDRSRGRWKLYMDGYTLVEGGIGYRWGNDAKHTVQVTAKNLFDEDYIRGDAKRGDEQRFILRYRVKM
ncbi:TonB-dependent siderophore receptor [Pelagicoccus mobilis]|uniref:TonB-dependent receptor n=1 Tax=Pelagicoccus mobilis TaxID=415221 RepID=A0A934RR31_9BACT|nr:TonB-dependent receptor [Pelagicoccus mobilis]MBK1875342.1 TonB-dependent receptor [Pelagicoccus mobilis]